MPREPVAIAVALADKLDLIAGFFSVDERPSGSGDPFALRRAALGIIRIIREAGLRLRLRQVIRQATQALDAVAAQDEIFAFIIERLRVQLRSEGARHDVLAAVFAAGEDDDLVRLLARSQAVAALLEGPDGANLLGGYRRADNILRIEDRRDGPHRGPVDADLLEQAEERDLAQALDLAEPQIEAETEAENFAAAMTVMASLRAPLDVFFDKVTVNAERPALRHNRLALLHRTKLCMDAVADFSKIET